MQQLTMNGNELDNDGTLRDQAVSSEELLLLSVTSQGFAEEQYLDRYDIPTGVDEGDELRRRTPRSVAGLDRNAADDEVIRMHICLTLMRTMPCT